MKNKSKTAPKSSKPLVSKKALPLMATIVILAMVLFTSATYYLSSSNLPWIGNGTEIEDVSANPALNCYKWDFNNMGHGQIVTKLTNPRVGSLNPGSIGVSYRNNIKPSGDYNDPFKVLNVMVVDPYANTNTPDLRANSGKVMILNGGKHYRVSDTKNENPVYNQESGTYNRDNHHGGDLILDLRETNASQIKFSTVDMGDENDGKGRINNNYYTVVASGQSETVNLAVGANQVVDNRIVNHGPTKDYPQGMSSLTLHFSGSAALDNLEICRKVSTTHTADIPPSAAPTPTLDLPPTSVWVSDTPTPKLTNTPQPPQVTNTPTPKPTTVVTSKSCTQKETRIFYSGEFVAHDATKRNFKVVDMELSEVAKKYDIKVETFWGWTGAKDQKGKGNAQLVQNNERHNVLVRLLDNQSSATKSTSIVCDDLGNTLTYDDGTKPLLKVSLKFAERLLKNRFLGCRKNISIEASNGSLDNSRTVNPEGKYDRLTVNSVLDYTPESYNACMKVPGGNKKKCAQSHYSRVTVEYCTREG